MSQIISTKSNKFTRYWFATVDNDVSQVTQATFTKTIERVLNDPKGWISQGYQFQRIYVSDGLKLRKDNPSNQRDIFHIRLSLNKTINRECKFSGLSCADMSLNMILLNANRWLNGSNQSGLPLSEYRRYMILHEVGHLLGRDHSTCPGDGELRPIMVQATIANDKCKPNSWILPND